MQTRRSFFSSSNRDSFDKSILPYAVLAKLDALYRKKMRGIIADSKQQMRAVVQETKKQLSDHLKKIKS